MYMMATWFTDLMDIYRVQETTEDGLTTQGLALVKEHIPCRIYSVQVNNWNSRNGAATSRADEKLACNVEVDVQDGDTLYVTRGGAMNRGRKPERFIASKPKAYYDPVGGALTGLEHLEVGLHADNIVE